MLVLLIIMILAAPLIRHGVLVPVPAAANGRQQVSGERAVIVSLKADGRLFLGWDPVAESDLRERIREKRERGGGEPSFLRADRLVPFGRVRGVMNAFREAGVDTVTLVTSSPASRREPRPPPRP